MSLEQKIEALTEAVEQLTRTLQIQTAARAGASIQNEVVITATAPYASTVETPGKTQKPEKAAITATAQGSSTATETSAPVSAPDADTATDSQKPDATTSETELTPEAFYKDKLLPKFKDLLATGQQAKAKAALTKFNVGQLAQLPPDVKVYQDFLVEIGG